MKNRVCGTLLFFIAFCFVGSAINNFDTDAEIPYYSLNNLCEKYPKMRNKQGFMKLNDKGDLINIFTIPDSLDDNMHYVDNKLFGLYLTSTEPRDLYICTYDMQTSELVEKPFPTLETSNPLDSGNLIRTISNPLDNGNLAVYLDSDNGDISDRMLTILDGKTLETVLKFMPLKDDLLPNGIIYNSINSQYILASGDRRKQFQAYYLEGTDLGDPKNLSYDGDLEGTDLSARKITLNDKDAENGKAWQKVGFPFYPLTLLIYNSQQNREKMLTFPGVYNIFMEGYGSSVYCSMYLLSENEILLKRDFIKGFNPLPEQGDSRNYLYLNLITGDAKHLPFKELLCLDRKMRVVVATDEHKQYQIFHIDKFGDTTTSGMQNLVGALNNNTCEIYYTRDPCALINNINHIYIRKDTYNDSEPVISIYKYNYQLSKLKLIAYVEDGLIEYRKQFIDNEGNLNLYLNFSK